MPASEVPLRLAQGDLFYFGFFPFHHMPHWMEEIFSLNRDTDL